MVWVPFGYFTAFTSSKTGSLQLFAMPYVNHKMIRRQSTEHAQLVLWEIERTLKSQADDPTESCVWDVHNGLGNYREWVSNSVVLLHENASEKQPMLADGIAAEDGLAPAASVSSTPSTPAPAATELPAPKEQVEEEPKEAGEDDGKKEDDE